MLNALIHRQSKTIGGCASSARVPLAMLLLAAVQMVACGDAEPTATPLPPTSTAVPPTATTAPPTPTFTPDQRRGEEIRRAALDYLETVLFFQSAFESLVFEISAAGQTGFSVTFADELADELINAESNIENAHYYTFTGHSWPSQFEEVITKGQELIEIGMENVRYILDEISLDSDEAQVLMADVLWADDESEAAASDFRDRVVR